MTTKKTNIENKEIWNANANDWDRFMGERGNNWHNELIAPQTEKLLALKAGDKLLDVGCGNGLFARRMAKKNIAVTAFDFSKANIENAKKYNTENIEYKVLDATDEKDFDTLHKGSFNGIAANMVLMDMPCIKTLFRNLKKLLTEKGAFVFSVQHPAFNSNYTSVEEGDNLLLKNYTAEETYKGKAIPQQSQRQYYFHRPVAYYLQAGFENGLLVTDYLEPTFENNDDKLYSKFPPVLIIKMKPHN